MSPPASCRESSREMFVNPAPPLEPASPLDKKNNTEACPSASWLARLGRLETCLLLTPPASCRKVGVAAEMDARDARSSTGQLDPSRRVRKGVTHKPTTPSTAPRGAPP